MSENALLNVLMMPDYRQDNPYQGLLANALNECKTSVFFCKGYRRVFPLFRQLQMQENSIDVLHIHWLNPYLKGSNFLIKFFYCLKFLLDIILVKSRRVRIVWTIHNLIAHNTTFPLLEKWLKQIFLSYVDQAIVHSKVAKTQVLDTYRVDAQKIAVIPHGHYRQVYMTAISKEDARRKLSLPVEKTIFLNFGMIKPYKGLESLLNIWQVDHSLADTAFLVIAGRALEEEYGEAISTQVSQLAHARFVNEFIPNDEVHLYFSAADVVVLPFTRILTSGSLILAMSYGKPVIAPRLENLLETLGEGTYLLYDDGDKKGLAQKIHASIGSNLGDVAKKTLEAGDHLDWQMIAEKTNDVYHAP
ncbi:glycosyl transferase group 1 [[Leptolyngbya] sp. PCC 7376]|uniref:glycosyltransferase n=1 Tax=[Leptolyngbya] sp. PCC 7376 TaxID=111781 RepID=UPI00029EC887|nr:glycosyltransferase [[Leptolyngbya] sp. PCC 7376]AFY37241.1 glycosyl transferase group 1 [[Leptolyngbya] sp. PCC 7376]